MNDRFPSRGQFQEGYQTRHKIDDYGSTGHFTPFALDATRREQFAKAASAAIAKQRGGQIVANGGLRSGPGGNNMAIRSMRSNYATMEQRVLYRRNHLNSEPVPYPHHSNDLFSHPTLNPQRCPPNASMLTLRPSLQGCSSSTTFAIHDPDSKHHDMRKVLISSALDDYSSSESDYRQQNDHRRRRKNNHEYRQPSPNCRNRSINRQCTQSPVFSELYERRQSNLNSFGEKRSSSSTDGSFPRGPVSKQPTCATHCNTFVNTSNRKRSYRDLDAPVPEDDSCLDGRRIVSYADIAPFDGEFNNESNGYPDIHHSKIAHPTNSAQNHDPRIDADGSFLFDGSTGINPIADDQQNTTNTLLHNAPAEEAEEGEIIDSSQPASPVDEVDDPVQNQAIIKHVADRQPALPQKRNAIIHREMRRPSPRHAPRHHHGGDIEDEFEKQLRAAEMDSICAASGGRNFSRNRCNDVKTASSYSRISQMRRDFDTSVYNSGALDADKILKHLTEGQGDDLVDEGTAPFVDVPNETLTNHYDINLDYNSADEDHEHSTCSPIKRMRRTDSIQHSDIVEDSVSVELCRDFSDMFIESKSLAMEHQLTLRPLPAIFIDYEHYDAKFRDFRRHILREYTPYHGCSRLAKPITNFLFFDVLNDQLNLHDENRNSIPIPTCENVKSTNKQPNAECNKPNETPPMQTASAISPCSYNPCSLRAEANQCVQTNNFASPQVFRPTDTFSEYTAISKDSLSHANLLARPFDNCNGSHHIISDTRFSQVAPPIQPVPMQSGENQNMLSNCGANDHIPFSFHPAVPPPNYRQSAPVIPVASQNDRAFQFAPPMSLPMRPNPAFVGKAFQNDIAAINSSAALSLATLLQGAGQPGAKLLNLSASAEALRQLSSLVPRHQLLAASNFLQAHQQRIAQFHQQSLVPPNTRIPNQLNPPYSLAAQVTPDKLANIGRQLSQHAEKFTFLNESDNLKDLSSAQRNKPPNCGDISSPTLELLSKWAANNLKNFPITSSLLPLAGQRSASLNNRNAHFGRSTPFGTLHHRGGPAYTGRGRRSVGINHRPTIGDSSRLRGDIARITSALRNDGHIDPLDHKLSGPSRHLPR